MFAIGHQAVRPGACPSGGCSTASGAYSGVYNSHATPHQNAIIGIRPIPVELQPGLSMPRPYIQQPVLGKNPIGNYLINQSVPRHRDEFAQSPPQVGGNATVTDMGLTWQICENVGLFGQRVCRTEPKNFAQPLPQPKPYQKANIPALVERGRPVVGGNATVTDIGIAWQICQPMNMGLFTQQVCRTEPKFS